MISYDWKPSIHMPRWASRILLEIDEIRAKRVQDISIYDIHEEGFIPNKNIGVTLFEFGSTWDSIYSKQGLGWDANPWV
jgi:hypothetical protein